MTALRLLEGRAHYEAIFGAVREARTSVWIATANVKDVHVEAPAGTLARARGRFVSALDILAGLARSGVDVRLLHAGVPSRAFRASLEGAVRGGAAGLRMRRCPRVHLKMVAVDGASLYLGSANFTGAGIGAKGDGRRNFEAGVFTDDTALLDAMQSRFDAIWSGRECRGCALRAECPAPIDRLLAAARPTSEAQAASRPQVDPSVAGQGTAKLAGQSLPRLSRSRKGTTR